MQTLSSATARALCLDSQGLRVRRPFGKDLPGVVATVERLGYVQLDTISVIQRAHHHVLWSRLPDYRPEFLDRAVSSGLLFEYWSHAAAFLPIGDFRFSLPMKRSFAQDGRHWHARDERVRRRVLERIRADGPLSARDFAAADGRRTGPWWGWKPAKIALEQLFMEGQLMVRERRAFQKIYDLTERVLPAGVDTTMPSTNELLRHRILSTVQAHGMATIPMCCYPRKTSPDVEQVVTELVDEGILTRVQVSGLDQPTWALRSKLEDHETMRGLRVGRTVRLLSPFDNLVIQRQRLAELFDFEYRIECYVRQEKRQWGYFCLPILWGRDFIGLCDAKAERRARRLHLKALYLDRAGDLPDAIIAPLVSEIRRFAEFNDCGEVAVERVEPRRLLPPIRRQLA